MLDYRPYLKSKLHVTVWLKGQCKHCRYVNQTQIHDYGLLTLEEIDRQLEATKHSLKPFPCVKCGSKIKPESLIYREERLQVDITECKISYGHAVDGEQGMLMEQAHQERYQIFEKSSEEFWEKYTDYALAHWRDMVNELVDFEFQDAYKAMNIDCAAKTVAQYRKDALNRFKTIEEKQTFWRLANDYLVYHHLLHIGPLGWALDEDVKYYGQKRIRFMVLHFPLGEALEGRRTEWIGRLIKTEKGDNAFLFRRISMLTDELNRTRRRMSSYLEHMEEMKAEKAKLESKLHEAYEQLKQERGKKNVATRDPRDVQKIQELKSFIGELIGELKAKDALLQEFRPQPTHPEEPTTILEEPYTTDERIDLHSLTGKNVAIIGGHRSEQAQQEYPCTVLVHSGEALDPDFYQVLKQADVIVVLTQFIRHAAMWEAKAYALQHDTPIYFMKGLNIPNLLGAVSKKMIGSNPS
jgi:hypothetical protein